MSISFEVNAKTRTDLGKGASRRLRHDGLVPAVVYGNEIDPASIALDHNTLILQLDNEAFYSHILQLTVDGGKSEQVILKDLQRHPAKPFIMHADFQRVNENVELKTHVALHFIGASDAPGVKAGGQVSHNISDVEISCLPGNLPEFIEVDISAMDIGDVIHLAELKLPEGVSLPILAQGVDHDFSVVNIHAKAAVEEEDDAAADAAAAAGDSAEEEPAADE